MVIFSYTGLPQVKISQKVLGGYFFLTHTVYVPNAITAVIIYCFLFVCTAFDGGTEFTERNG